MWILFALTSAFILSSRKIQEKKLVGEAGSSLAWMIRLGSAIAILFIWLIFSRDLTGVYDLRFWWVILFVAFIMYPLQMKLYFHAMHELPLSLFGMLWGLAPLTSMIVSRVFLGLEISFSWIVGILLVLIAIWALFYREYHKDIAPLSLIIGILSNMLMWVWSVIDRFGISFSNPYIYSLVVQAVSAFTLFLSAYFFSKWWTQFHFFQKNKTIILIIGLSQWIGWVLSSFAILWTPNPWYASALINTHAIITALYGVFVLGEEVTKRKIFVFFCMALALLAFAFA
jgi:drug/metabolite transporter (DMT)-like permease